ncbi:MAG: hypothetical protein GC190_08080 [Alphaproteobacteria bacterium]|nr:hypothetical protein [Alphaproteobacteria bacterium]
MTQESWKADKVRVGLVLASLIAALAGSYFAEPYVRENTDAITILITVFTVFAGFLFAVIAVLGDPALIQGDSWRSIEGQRDAIAARVLLHSMLFTLYLIAIGLVFVGVVLRKAADVPTAVNVWITRAYLFLGIWSFLLTFGLPASLLRLQLARLDAETEKRRKAAGIDDTKGA